MVKLEAHALSESSGSGILAIVKEGDEIYTEPFSSLQICHLFFLKKLHTYTHTNIYDKIILNILVQVSVCECAIIFAFVSVVCVCMYV